jgi:hypothetical protein
MNGSTLMFLGVSDDADSTGLNGCGRVNLVIIRLL